MLPSSFCLCFTFLSLLTAPPAFGQQLYRIQHFSDKYYGKVWLAKPSEVADSGWVAVYDKATNKLLLKVSADALAVGVTDSQLKAGVQELPYNEQSVIQYADFNFDGRKDFALEDGQTTCGPSFRVYLAQGSRFVFSEEFTALAQEGCGLFRVNKLHKRLVTESRSGCCWHEANEYVVRHNVPMLVKGVQVESTSEPFIKTYTNTWNGKSMESDVAITLESGMDVFSFRLAGNGKKLVLFSDGEKLGYALLTPAGRVEFHYPAFFSDGKPGDFTLDLGSPTKTLLFKNGNTQYVLSDGARNPSAPSQGVTVVTPTKTVSLPGSPGTGQGSLARLATLKLANVTIKPVPGRK